ncbi:MAG TPA: hypothetical protein PKI62_00820 [bacterium]|nr:hypothetical protein [bacterium]HPR86835.1 hypothetical protein [bacterium]
MKRVVLAVLLCSAVLAFAQSPATLRYAYETGKTYTYALTAQTTVTMEMNGQEMITEMGQNAKLTIQPQGVTEQGNFKCWVSFPELSVKIKNFRMDTTLVMSGLLNKRAEIVHSPLGKVLSSMMIDTLQADPMMGQMGIEPATLFKRLLVTLPEASIATGGSWTDAQVDTVHQGGIAVVITPALTFTLIGEEEHAGVPCQKIAFTGTMKLNGSGSQMGANVTVDGDGKQEGVIYFAPATGLLVGSETSGDQDMTIAVTGPANMTFPQAVSTKSTLTLLP